MTRIWQRIRFLNAIIVALLVAVALIECTSILAGAMVRIKNQDELIKVVGSARKPIRSDLIIWKGRVTQGAPTLGQGYSLLKLSTDRVRAYLIGKGLRASELFPLAISAQTLYARPKRTPKTPGADSGPTRVIGYALTQEIEVRSVQVALVDRIARESTELISNGMHFESENPEYLYTKMGELKVVMQAEAAHDARARADQIAVNSGCRVGKVRYARMSVPQITPLYSTQESDGGYDDTSSMDKKITAIVVAGFSIR